MKVESVREDQVLGFRLEEHRLEPGFRLPQHEHDTPVLVLLYEGRFKGVARSGEYAIGAGDRIMAPAAVDHQGVVGPEGSRVVLISPVGIRARAMPRLTSTTPTPLGGATAARLARRVDQELGSKDPASPLALEAAVLDLFALAIRGSRKGTYHGREDWLDGVTARLEAEITAPPRTQQLAESLDVSASRLHRAFRRRYGCSVGDWVRERRLVMAADLLVTSRRTLSQVALEVGYYDQSHLTNAFKKHFGCTPAVYRAAHRS